MSALLTAFLAWGAIEAAARDARAFLAGSAPWMALAVWLMVVMWVMPCVAVRDDGVEVVGVIKRWWIPWEALADVHQGWTLKLRCKDGSEIGCFSAPTQSFDTRISRGLRPGDFQPRAAPSSRDARHSASFIVGTRWISATGGAASVTPGDTGPAPTSTWRWPSLVCGAVLGAWCILAALL